MAVKGKMATYLPGLDEGVAVREVVESVENTLSTMDRGGKDVVLVQGRRGRPVACHCYGY